MSAPIPTDPAATTPTGGAGTDDTTATGQQPGTTDAGNPAGADALGDPGKKALDLMKGERNLARQQHRAVVDALAEQFHRTPEQVREALQAGTLADLMTSTTVGEPGKPDTAADVTRQIAEAQRTATKAQSRILAAELKAAAAGKLADPTDVVLIDTSTFVVDHAGDVDPSDIADAIDDLIRRKPHLAAAAQRGPTFGTADAGPRNGSTAGQLTEADLTRMKPEQIVEAQRKGLLNALLGITT